ncbi:hypothetical protein ACFO3J_31445 [Streptomyces polygonati]|uniref:Bulb-type lectin domain-containing protein n=1 Tax=Streptomyces polygonati TaxID=1617087 RepID=A0ABV8HVC8_9ACTN
MALDHPVSGPPPAVRTAASATSPRIRRAIALPLNDDDLGGSAASAAIAAAQVVATSTAATATVTATGRRSLSAVGRPTAATAVPENAVHAGGTLAGRLFRPDSWRHQQSAATGDSASTGPAASSAAQPDGAEATLTGVLAAAVAEERSAVKPARAAAATGAKLGRWPLMTAAAFAGAVLVSVPFVHNGNRDTTTTYEGAGRPLPIASLDDPEQDGEHNGGAGPDGYSSQMPEVDPADGTASRPVPEPETGTRPFAPEHGGVPHLNETAVVPSTGPVGAPIPPLTGTATLPGTPEGTAQLPSRPGPFAEQPLVGVGDAPVLLSGIPFAPSLAAGGTDQGAAPHVTDKPKADPAPRQHTDRATADPQPPAVKTLTPPATPAVHTDAVLITHPTQARATVAKPSDDAKPASKPTTVKAEVKPPTTQAAVPTPETSATALVRATPAKPATGAAVALPSAAVPAARATPAIPGVPVTLATPATSAVPAIPAVPATPTTAAIPATPAVPADQTKPASVQPVVTATVAKPATTKPATPQQVTRPAVTKPAVTTTTASTTAKPTVGKPAADKPTTAKPTSNTSDAAASASTAATPATPVWHQKTIGATYVLNPGESVASDRMRITMRSSGSLVISDEDGVIRWSSHTPGTGNHAVFQDDGHFVVYSTDNETLWSSGTAGNPGSHLVIQQDGDVTITSPSGGVLWSAGTAH